MYSRQLKARWYLGWLHETFTAVQTEKKWRENWIIKHLEVWVSWAQKICPLAVSTMFVMWAPALLTLGNHHIFFKNDAVSARLRDIVVKPLTRVARSTCKQHWEVIYNHKFNEKWIIHENIFFSLCYAKAEKLHKKTRQPEGTECLHSHL